MGCAPSVHSSGRFTPAQRAALAQEEDEQRQRESAQRKQQRSDESDEMRRLQEEAAESRTGAKLMAAVQAKDEDTVRQLLACPSQRKTSVLTSALHAGIPGGQTGVVDLLLAAGASSFLALGHGSGAMTAVACAISAVASAQAAMRDVTAEIAKGATILAVGSDDGTIQLWDAKSHLPLGALLEGHSGRVHCVAFSPDGTVLASGSGDNTVRLWDTESGELLGAPLVGHTGHVNSVVFSPDGRVVASGSDDNTLRLWDAETGGHIGMPMEGHDMQVSSIAFSPDGTVLASGSWDYNLRLWDAKTGQPLGGPLKGHRGMVNSVAFAPCGTFLASGADDSRVRLWDAKTGKPIGSPLKGHSNQVVSVAFSPDGTKLASGSKDCTARLWDAKTLALLGAPMEGHYGHVKSVAFSPDGHLLATGSDDESVRLWDTTTGAAVGKPLEGNGGKVLCVAFSPDANSAESSAAATAQTILNTVQASCSSLVAAADAACAAIVAGQLSALGRCVKHMPAACNTLTHASGPHHGWSPVHLACEHGQMRMLLAMLDMPSVEVDLPAGPTGGRPLGTAADFGQARVCSALLDRGADVNAVRSSDGFTALHVAVAAESMELSVLLASQATVNMNVKAAPSWDTPLHIAVARGYEGLVKVLLDAGAETDMVNARGESPLLLAVQGKQAGIMHMLIKEGQAGLNLRLVNGNTVLHKAAKAGNEAAVRALLLAGADHKVVNAAHMRPSMVASTPAIAELLKGLAEAEPPLPPPEEEVVVVLRKRSASAGQVSATGMSRTGLGRQQRSNRVSENSQAVRDAAAQARMDGPQRPVFLSFGAREARPQALAVKRQLEAQGIPAFCSETDIPAGADRVKSISQALASCKVMVVIQSASYGSADGGDDVFQAYEELVHARHADIPIYVIRMATGVKEAGIRAMLKTMQGVVWENAVATADDPTGLKLSAPDKALADIQAILWSMATDGNPSMG